jgi:hypothetical protein
VTLTPTRQLPELFWGKKKKKKNFFEFLFFSTISRARMGFSRLPVECIENLIHRKYLEMWADRLLIAMGLPRYFM